MVCGLYAALLPSAWPLPPELRLQSLPGTGSIKTSCSFVSLDEVEGREKP